MTLRSLSRQSGLSVVEVVVSASIVGTIVLIAASAVTRSFRASSVLSQGSNMERRAQTAIDTIAGALSDAGKTTLSACAPPTGASTLTFRAAGGFTGGNTTWQNEQSIGWFPSPTDPTNGKDDDKNGIVDDGVVVWTRNVGVLGENKTTLASCVPALAPGETTNSADDNGDGLRDERGLSFSLTGNALTVRLAVVAKSQDGSMVIRKAQRTIALSN